MKTKKMLKKMNKSLIALENKGLTLYSMLYAVVQDTTRLHESLARLESLSLAKAKASKKSGS